MNLTLTAQTPVIMGACRRPRKGTFTSPALTQKARRERLKIDSRGFPYTEGIIWWAAEVGFELYKITETDAKQVEQTQAQPAGFNCMMTQIMSLKVKLFCPHCIPLRRNCASYFHSFPEPYRPALGHFKLHLISFTFLFLFFFFWLACVFILLGRQLRSAGCELIMQAELSYLRTEFSLTISSVW